MLDDPRASYGSLAVSEEAPAGQSVRYDPDFEVLEAEVTKMDTAGPAAVDWEQVARDGLEIVRARSKDLLVASYVCYALFRTEGYRGLAVGLGVIADMVDVFWDDLLPPKRRERARVQALEWVAERLAPLVQERRPEPQDDGAVVAAHQAIDRLSDLLDAKLEKTEASLGDLLRPLRDYSRDAERRMAEEAERAAAEAAKTAEPEPSAAPEEPAGETPSQAAAEKTGAGSTAEAAAASPAGGTSAQAPAAPVATPGPPARPAAVAPPAQKAVETPAAEASPAETMRALRQLRGNMIDFAKALRSADPWDPRAFVLVRTAGQLLIAAMPDVADGRLDVPPPNPDDAAALAAFAARGDHEKGIAMGEDFIVAAPFWLDAHRMVAEMIGDQGPPAAPARAAAEKAAMALCGRFNGLEHLAFQDGTPTADETTRAWLAGLGGPGGGAPPPPEEAALEEARHLARQGELGRAAALLAEGPGGEGGRARALWQIARARFCLDIGRPHGAVAILEALEAELAAPPIAAYDPRLRVEALSLLVRAIERIPAPADDGARQAELERLRKTLYSLDLPTAIGLLQP